MTRWYLSDEFGQTSGGVGNDRSGDTARREKTLPIRYAHRTITRRSHAARAFWPSSSGTQKSQRVPLTRHLTVVFDNFPFKGSFRRTAWLTTSSTHKNPFRKPTPT